MSIVLQDCRRLLVQPAGGVGRVAPWACPPRTGRIKGPVPRVQSCGPQWERIQMRVESRSAVCLHRVTPTPIGWSAVTSREGLPQGPGREEGRRGRAGRSWRTSGSGAPPDPSGSPLPAPLVLAAAREWVSPSPRTRVAKRARCRSVARPRREERAERDGRGKERPDGGCCAWQQIVRTKAESQRIVATRPLCRVQYPVPYSSRLQVIHRPGSVNCDRSRLRQCYRRSWRPRAGGALSFRHGF